jgi:hypothetical protein
MSHIKFAMDDLKAYTSLELFFMRLPSSSSLILASLVVSSSSLSALAAPVGDGPEDSLSYAPTAVLLAQQHAPIPPISDDTIIQLNSEPSRCTHHHLPLSNTATDHLQTSSLVDKATAPLLPVLPDILHAISDPLVGNDTSLPRGHVGRQVTAGSGKGNGPENGSGAGPTVIPKPP